MSEQLDRIEQHVQRIDVTIHGNGQPGLKTTVAEHDQTLSVFKRILWGIGAALGTVFTAVAIVLARGTL
jgi:hypothetical protein